MIRTAWVFLGTLVTTLFYGGRIIFSTLVGSDRLTGLCEVLPRTWSRHILRLSGVRVHVEGAENLLDDRPKIVVANHQSWYDVFALAAELPVRYRFVAKKELARIPVFGPAWRACGHISVDRDDRQAAVDSLDAAGESIRSHDFTIVMFPEGTRSATGELRSFKKGAFVLAIKAGVPVVPVAVLGTRAVMPKGSWRIRSGEIRIRIGVPISTDGLRHRDRDRLLGEAWGALAELMGEERPDGRAPGPASGSREPDGRLRGSGAERGPRGRPPAPGDGEGAPAGTPGGEG